MAVFQNWASVGRASGSRRPLGLKAGSFFFALRGAEAPLFHDNVGGGCMAGLGFLCRRAFIGFDFIAAATRPFSFAPSGLAHFSADAPTACAVGCILAPLRGWGGAALCIRIALPFWEKVVVPVLGRVFFREGDFCCLWDGGIFMIWVSSSNLGLECILRRAARNGAGVGEGSAELHGSLRLRSGQAFGEHRTLASG